MSGTWQPSASQAVRLLRAQVLGKIRHFMHTRGILEVETPILNRAGLPEANINALSTTLSIAGASRSLYLHTSPELYMKRLLCADSGAIYQISRVFRDGEAGRLHQPEFSLLEWYRPGFDHHALMDELAELLAMLGLPAVGKVTYASAFDKYLDINPHSAALTELQSLAIRLGLQSQLEERALLLDFLFSHAVSPSLGNNGPELLYAYPACQAALARLSPGNPVTAARFELFIDGMELANGYHELGDADEHRRRFQLENRLRRRRGLAEVRIDERFMQALQAGLPDCAGVALGIDRLLMVLSGNGHIDEVMTFALGDA